MGWFPCTVSVFSIISLADLSEILTPLISGRHEPAPAPAWASHPALSPLPGLLSFHGNTVCSRFLLRYPMGRAILHWILQFSLCCAQPHCSSHFSNTDWDKPVNQFPPQEMHPAGGCWKDSFPCSVQNEKELQQNKTLLSELYLYFLFMNTVLQSKSHFVNSFLYRTESTWWNWALMGRGGNYKSTAQWTDFFEHSK